MTDKERLALEECVEAWIEIKTGFTTPYIEPGTIIVGSIEGEPFRIVWTAEMNKTALPPSGTTEE